MLQEISTSDCCPLHICGYFPLHITRRFQYLKVATRGILTVTGGAPSMESPSLDFYRKQDLRGEKGRRNRSTDEHKSARLPLPFSGYQILHDAISTHRPTPTRKKGREEPDGQVSVLALIMGIGCRATEEVGDVEPCWSRSTRIVARSHPVLRDSTDCAPPHDWGQRSSSLLCKSRDSWAKPNMTPCPYSILVLERKNFAARRNI
ncbi:hypothetical protein HBH64_215430 [Parastagonospora nodorum]|nr:hypothetical protein HBH53_161040 [Parastagonospora nodorum]KAH3960644.1 hypothetical protein HBH51_189340 [Parastagonospora nodorum]KAH3962786.1 hypothetical protein HBH52_222000 [Parastagonospora nodorum]KAH4070891.1 hypothetical protein HBH50_090460 [Parastagonospora nodorum]KAH4092845.1 hypothetical protein HBH48_072930 [Parastagonospora nodorum]